MFRIRSRKFFVSQNVAMAALMIKRLHVYDEKLFCSMNDNYYLYSSNFLIVSYKSGKVSVCVFVISRWEDSQKKKIKKVFHFRERVIAHLNSSALLHTQSLI